MKLSFSDQQISTKPVTVNANWINPLNARSQGSSQFKLEATLIEKDEELTVFRLTFYAYTMTVGKAKVKQVVQAKNLNGKTVDYESSPTINEFVSQPIGQYEVRIDHTANLFFVTDQWESSAEAGLFDKKAQVVIQSLTYDRKDYKDVRIETNQCIFNTCVSLNSQAIFKNPTVSLLLRLIEVSDFDYSPVFTEWFEDQFINPNDDYRKAFGNKYLPEYQAFKKQQALEAERDAKIKAIMEMPDEEVIIDSDEELMVEYAQQVAQEVKEELELAAEAEKVQEVEYVSFAGVTVNED